MFITCGKRGKTIEQILNTLVEKYKDEMFEKIAEFVRLETVNDQSTATEGAPYGKANREALDKFMELGQNLGFEVKDYDGYAATLKWGNDGKEIGVINTGVSGIPLSFTIPPQSHGANLLDAYITTTLNNNLIE